MIQNQIICILVIFQKNIYFDIRKLESDFKPSFLFSVLEFVDGKRICDASITTGGIGEYTSRQYLRDIIAGLMYLHAHVCFFVSFIVVSLLFLFLKNRQFRI